MHQAFQLYLNLGFIKNPRCTSAGNLLKRKRVIMVNINVCIYIYNTKKYTSVHVQRFKQPNPQFISLLQMQMEKSKRKKELSTSGLFQVKYILFGSQVKRNTPFPFPPPENCSLRTEPNMPKFPCSYFVFLSLLDSCFWKQLSRFENRTIKK